MDQPAMRYTVDDLVQNDVAGSPRPAGVPPFPPHEEAAPNSHTPSHEQCSPDGGEAGLNNSSIPRTFLACQ